MYHRIKIALCTFNATLITDLLGGKTLPFGGGGGGGGISPRIPFGAAFK